MEKQQILIVDDEEVNREILNEMFRDSKEGYELLEATNGQEAISQIENHNNIVLILLDVVMPVMNGFSVLEYMHKEGMLQSVPVILITSEDELDTDDQAYSYGVADVIHKPDRKSVV